MAFLRTSSWNSRVQKFDPDGKFITQWKSGKGNFFGPRGIAVSPKNEVYVVDTGNKRVQVYTDNGAYLREWGSEGAADGFFDEPVGIDIDSLGNVYVADSRNKRVQVFDSRGRYLKQWSVIGWDDPFTQPHISVDSAGNVYCSDSTQHLIHFFTPGGKDVTLYGRKGSGSGQLNANIGISVDSKGNVYVADTYSDRILNYHCMQCTFIIVVLGLLLVILLSFKGFIKAFASC